MIKFFRKIRQKLLTENKSSKYLLYAIGEIVLVVIGILIALQINNWNEQRKMKILEVEVLKEIISDLQEDLLSLENDIGLNQKGLNSISVIRKALKSKQAYNNKLARHFANLDFNTTYTLKTSGYDNLRNLGFQIIAEDSIRKSITDLYASEYSFLIEREVQAEQKTFQFFSPKYIQHFKSLTSTEGHLSPQILYIPKDFEAMKTDTELNVLIDYNYLIKEDNLNSLRQTIVILKQTQSSINNYLNTLSTD